MKHVKIINDTNEVIILKTGNAGVYRVVKEIGAKDPDGASSNKHNTHNIAIDENATYSEYLCVEAKNKFTVTLSTDDLIDNKEITIERDGTSGLTWKRNSVRKEPESPAEPANGGVKSRVGRAIQWVKTILKKVIS